jgi:hypothetical protein
MYAAEQTWPARSPMMVNEHGREGNPRDLIATMIGVSTPCT